MKKIFFSVMFAFILFSSLSLVSAIDVAYIAKNNDVFDNQVMNEFSSRNYNVNIIESRDIRNTDFDNYEVIFVGNERLSNVRNLPNNIALISMNSYYAKTMGVVERGRMKRFVSNSPLTIMHSGSEKQVYTDARFEVGSKAAVPYYYIPKRYVNENSNHIATTTDFNEPLGDVISYMNVNGRNVCFFGITESSYWTVHSENMFSDCVDFVVNGVIDDGEEEPPIDEDGEMHDVSLSDLKISGIEDNVLTSGESYKILIDVMNEGDFVENVQFEGEIIFNGEVIDTFKHVSVAGLEVGEKKNDKSRTVNFDFSPGEYLIKVTGMIDEDDVPENNVVMMNVMIV